MADVFVSYKAEDRRRVKPLVDALEGEGFSVWWDAQIGGGSAWRQTIESELNAAKCVLVIWSKRSVGPEGEFVQDEATRAKRRHVYVPICIDRAEPPLGFGETQAIAINGWTGDRSDPRYEAILEAVRSVIAGTPRPSRTQPIAPAINRRLVLGGGAALTAAALAGGGLMLLKQSSPGAASDGIAVLPFANLSGDPAKAYFSDGVAEEIRSALSRIGGLKVIGRTSSEAVRNDDAKTAAQKLGVTNVLTGSVRQSPSTIRVTAELVDGHSGIDRWSQDYNRSPGDAIKIQMDIAENVANALSAALGPAAKAAIVLGGTTDVEAQDLYLKALAKYRTDDSEESLRGTIALLDSAITLDPRFASAYVQKARTLRLLAENTAGRGGQFQRAFQQAAAVARQGIALAPDLPVGHFVLGLILYDQLDVRGARAKFEKAHLLSNSDVSALRAYAGALSDSGHTDQAIDVLRQAVSLDPLDPLITQQEGAMLATTHRYDEAVAVLRKSLALAPQSSSIRGSLVYTFILSRKYSEAAAETAKLPTKDRPYFEALLFGRQANRAASDAALARYQEIEGDSANYGYAEIYADRGDRERAFAMLDRAWALRDPGLASLNDDPFMEPLRSDPRYAALLKKMNFPRRG